jgi:hypothetical protein
MQKIFKKFPRLIKLFCNHKWGGYNNKICKICGKCRGLPIYENCPPPPEQKNLSEMDIFMNKYMELHKKIIDSQTELSNMGSIGFFVYFHPTHDISEYEKYKDEYLRDDLKLKYENWKIDNQDVVDFFKA